MDFLSRNVHREGKNWGRGVVYVNVRGKSLMPRASIRSFSGDLSALHRRRSDARASRPGPAAPGLLRVTR